MSEVQTCLRLLILDLILRNVRSGGEQWRTHANEIIRCVRTVQMQPALAEAMLKHISKKLSIK